ncbi:MCE-family protein mce3A [Mycobacterium tuberculosis CAS/NITR204]|uniref:MCE-family protein mce3A n=2 Tax=Bacteria TaxID=2 RepID=R4MIZ7_MYCTX|nr:MCE-family protein mce3A [Mycobacterium tuberculosis CAS/NITR204]
MHDAWWTLILFAVIGVAVLVTAVSFTGSLRSTVPVTLTADRSGLVMDSGAKVMMRGVQVGRVAQIGRIEWAQNGASLRLEIDPDQIRYIPANVEAQISATTAFGAKFVDLVMPQNPSRARLSAGAVLHSKNVSTEINTVFENVVDLLNMIDPLKLNAVLTAVADAVRGQGERIGQATTDLNEVLEALNARGDTIGGNWRSLKNFTDTYDAAAQDILTILNAASTTSATVVNHSTQLDALLLNAIGLSNAGTNLLGSSRDNLVGAADILAPTTSLLFKYNPEYTCFLQGAKWYLDNGGYAAWGGADGRTLQLDVALLFGNDPYVYPDNLPVVAAKGGPGGRPGCGPLPDATHNFPVRQLVTNTGWGTGLDIRPNPGIGHPCWANYFPGPRGARPGGSCSPGRRSGPTPRRGSSHEGEPGGRRGAPRRLPGGMPADGVPADCRLRGGALRRRQDLLRRVRQRVQSANGQAGAHRRRRGRQGHQDLHQPRRDGAGAVHRRQLGHPHAGHPGGDPLRQPVR